MIQEAITKKPNNEKSRADSKRQVPENVMRLSGC